MYFKKVGNRLLIISYIQFFLCVTFCIGVASSVLHQLDFYIYLVMGGMLLCSGMLIIGLSLINYYYTVGVDETIHNLEELNTKLKTQRHDYLNHMQIVYGLLELDEYEDAKEYMQPVYQDILKVSKALKTSMPALNALLRAKMETANQNNIDFYLEVGSDLSKIKIEQWELCKVVANIIDNAVSAVLLNEGKRCIYVTISEDIQYYKFSIQNNGPEIPESMHQLIFKKGYTTKQEDGHGFGLMIIKQILENNHGEITLESDKEKTIFNVLIKKIGV